MKRLFHSLLLVAAALPLAAAPDAAKVQNTVVLDENGIRNLGLVTVEAEEQSFEETLFALGRVEPEPARRSVVTSRVPGRLAEIKLRLGDSVTAGAEVARLESRLPGDPPPVITLRAPQGGLVTLSEARVGEPIDPDRIIMEVTDLSEVLAIARVPEHKAARLVAGAKAHIKVAAVPDEVFEGELMRFGTATDRERGTIDAVFRLPNKGTRLRPGMRAEFSIVLSSREGVMAVPRAALQGDSLNRFVYVADYELKNAFVKTAVTVGAANDRFVEVLSGVFPGDKVVTQGAYSLAFAGKGSVSLKEALDAAHGHEHNEDGSEVTAEQRAARDGKKGAGTPGGESRLSTLTLVSLVGNALLLGVLLFGVRRRAPTAPEAPSAAAASPATPRPH